MTDILICCVDLLLCHLPNGPEHSPTVFLFLITSLWKNILFWLPHHVEDSKATQMYHYLLITDQLMFY